MLAFSSFLSFVCPFLTFVDSSLPLFHFTLILLSLSFLLLVLFVISRLDKLSQVSEYFLKRIIDGVESVPYGVRWVCKQLGALAQERFPNADHSKISSLVGGYIYLRFFSPVIVTPDAMNFISDKPSRVMRRNLILVSCAAHFSTRFWCHYSSSFFRLYAR